MERKGSRSGLKRLGKSPAVLATGASVLVALTIAAPGQALAQCVGSYHSNSGSGVHGTPSPNAGVHSATSTPSVHTGSASCPTGATATTTRVAPLHAANLNPGVGKPALGGAGHWHGAQHETVHVEKPNSKPPKP